MNIAHLSIYLHLLQFPPSMLWFSVYRSFNPLVKFIPKYLILFDATVNGIVFCISFSDSSLLVYGKATDVSMFILNPATTEFV